MGLSKEVRRVTAEEPAPPGATPTARLLYNPSGSDAGTDEYKGRPRYYELIADGQAQAVVTTVTHQRRRRLPPPSTDWWTSGSTGWACRVLPLADQDLGYESTPCADSPMERPARVACDRRLVRVRRPLPRHRYRGRLPRGHH
ncbi:hypothetical protein GCM10010502_57240 [Kitasatospora aureofaciens]|uniref:Uncharacterized protein n=1 Tax=Kitasatospora aureofaciens TaxID=1894 RepID=A0A8H9HYK0_KITAU|nr:hypothetical protein GCM10010502_57240 [Kitasatospora aureofaciens]